jgi:hypothetical protein
MQIRQLRFCYPILHVQNSFIYKTHVRSIMRRLEQNGKILIRALLISGLVIGMTMIVGIHPVIGSSQAAFDQGYETGQNDCLQGKNSNPNGGPPNAPRYYVGYIDGWEDAGCP